MPEDSRKEALNVVEVKHFEFNRILSLTGSVIQLPAASENLAYTILSPLRGARVQVITGSKIKQLDRALIATGFPYNRSQLFDKVSHILKSFLGKAQDIRRLGSAALDLAYVAAGRFDAFYEYNLNPWDVAAGAYIVKQSGGEVLDFKGTDDYLYGKEILAANRELVQPML